MEPIVCGENWTMDIMIYQPLTGPLRKLPMKSRFPHAEAYARCSDFPHV